MENTNHTYQPQNGFARIIGDYFKGSVIDQGCSSSHLLACLASSGSETTLSQSIQNVTESVTERKLSLLHVTVIMGRCELAKQLLESRLVDINAQDIRGWTALHFAAATCNDQMMDLLQEVGANQTLRNDLGGTAQNIWEMIHAPHKDPKEYAIYHEKSGVVKKIDGVAFQKLTGANYSDEVLTDPKFLAKDWSSLTSTVPSLSQLQIEIAKQYESFRSAPPKVYMTDCIKTDCGADVRDVGFGVCAKQDIEPFEILTEYIGEEIDDEERKSSNLEYELMQIDSDYTHKIRGLGSIMQDGCPNVTALPIWVDGRRRLVFVSLEKIKKDENIVFNYISHRIKYNGHKELRPAALREYFQKNSPQEISKRLESVSFATESEIYDHKELDSLTKLLYLITTPTALIDLLLRKVISTKDLPLLKNISLLQQQEVLDFIISSGILTVIDQYLVQDEYKNVNQILLQLIEEGEIQSVIQIFPNFETIIQIAKEVPIDLRSCKYIHADQLIRGYVEIHIKPILPKRKYY